jgi:hypothetical protein
MDGTLVEDEAVVAAPRSVDVDIELARDLIRRWGSDDSAIETIVELSDDPDGMASLVLAILALAGRGRTPELDLPLAKQRAREVAATMIAGDVETTGDLVLQVAEEDGVGLYWLCMTLAHLVSEVASPLARIELSMQAAERLHGVRNPFRVIDGGGSETENP